MLTQNGVAVEDVPAFRGTSRVHRGSEVHPDAAASREVQQAVQRTIQNGIQQGCGWASRPGGHRHAAATAGGDHRRPPGDPGQRADGPPGARWFTRRTSTARPIRGDRLDLGGLRGRPDQGHRPVLVVGRDRQTLLGLMLSSQSHHMHDPSWVGIGAGDWDHEGRPSWVRLDRVLDVPEESIRREGAIVDRITFEIVATRLRTEYSWS